MSENAGGSRKFQYVAVTRLDKYSEEPTDRQVRCLCCQDFGIIPGAVLAKYVEVVPGRGRTLSPELIVRPWDAVVSAPMACSATGCRAYPEKFNWGADTWLSAQQCDFIAAEERRFRMNEAVEEAKLKADKALHESGKVADLNARRAIQQASAAIGREMPTAPPPPEPIEAVAVGDDIGWEDW